MDCMDSRLRWNDTESEIKHHTKKRNPGHAGVSVFYCS
ncbi:hypothetical protein MICA_1976 [Micavibrio aeruginosavorus ARL-13]|uniref:Uncharacterized protein n=1 Tax=Micavibrio aeruginosavorus (strain ARL-13) TaxID=856793 RepID=G2KNP0_MICAA|nr:hypothetical protein MICA_1976 [Micavibrio aeruginosavorus ARL-13]